MRYLFLCTIFFLQAFVIAQQKTEIKIQTPDALTSISSFFREGTLYVSASALAEKLSIDFNSEKDETIILSSYPDEVLIKGRNPFFVITNSETDVKRVFQIPTSTYTISGDVYIPLIYTASMFQEIFNIKILYDDKRKLITADSKTEVGEVISSSKSRFDISDLEIVEKANGTLVRLSSSRGIRYYNSSYIDGQLTIILRGVNTDSSITERISLKGLIKKMTITNIGPDTEIKMIVGSDYSANEILKEKENSLLITLHNKIFIKDNDKAKDKWEFDIIVIDAGHGGKDAGAIGINGEREKNINLAIALKLGRMIEEKIPGVKVEYTRTKDTFVELYKRGRIANEVNGKLFISIHCNATADRSSKASGFEVYLLRPGRTREAISIAERENSVIKYEDDPKRYQQLTDENFILVSMAHSAYMKYSEKFTEYLDKNFTANFNLPNRGVKQAGFYVLVGASMPGVLVEAGFLSNKNDAAYLSSEKGQEKTADLIFQSIQSFRNYYESFTGSN